MGDICPLCVFELDLPDCSSNCLLMKMGERQVSGKRFVLTRRRCASSSTYSFIDDSPERFSQEMTSIAENKTFLLKIARLVPACLIDYHLEKLGNTDLQPFSEEYDAAVLFADISGFSALAECLAKEMGSNANAAEDLSAHIGKSLEVMVKTVCSMGGDVIKFAGDAILVVFKASLFADDLKAATRCCIQVALNMLELDLRAGGVRLSIHCGIGSGKLIGYHIGGLHKRWEYVITGSPVEQIGSAEPEANAGEVVVSEQVHILLETELSGSLLPSKNFKVDRFLKTMILEEKELVFDRLIVQTQQVEELKRMSRILRSYVPRSVLLAMDCGKGGWIAELRVCSTVFCRLIGLSYVSILDLPLIQQAFFTVQKQLYKYEGTLCRFIVDDKGAGILFAFGLPPFMHENDAVRATKAALEIHQSIQLLRNPRRNDLVLDSSLGVTTGRVFCGTVGGSIRCEYTLHGTLVNLAARLMVKAMSGVLCSEEVHHEAKNNIIFDDPEEIIVKGKEEAVKVYRPKKSRVNDINLQGILLNLKPLPGRQKEEGMMRELIINYANGSSKGGCIVIEGEPGIGKTRLTKFCHKISLETDRLLYFYGKSADTEASTPLYTWQVILSQIIIRHYICAVGQYIWLSADSKEGEVYTAVKSNDFKFKVEFFAQVKQLSFPSYASLPEDLKLAVVKDLLSELPLEQRNKIGLLKSLLPDALSHLTHNMQDGVQQSYSCRRELLNLLCAILKSLIRKIRHQRKHRKHRRQSGFRSSIPSIVGFDVFNESMKEDYANEEFHTGSDETTQTCKDSKAVSSVKHSMNALLLQKNKKQVASKSMFGFSHRRKGVPSFSSTKNDSDGDMAIERIDSSRSEPHRILYDSDSLGGNAEHFVSGFLRMSDYIRVVFCLEGIENLDITSFQLVEQLLKHESAVIIILTLRSKNLRKKQAKPIYADLMSNYLLQHVVLKKLLFEELRQAICMWLEIEHTPDTIVQIVHEKSNGLPMFAEELTKLLIFRNIIEVKGSLCSLVDTGNVKELDLPDNISTLITAKLDQLRPIQLLVLKKISVLGMEFTRAEALELIKETDDQGAENLSYEAVTELSELITSGMLLVSSLEKISFQSSIFRESAYNLLLYKDRKRMHMKAAENLYNRNVDYLEIVCEKLADHYYLAEEFKVARNLGRKSRAIRFLELYGKESIDSRNMEEVYSCYARLLKIEQYFSSDECAIQDLEFHGGTHYFLEKSPEWKKSAAIAVLDLSRVEEAIVLINETLTLLNLQPKVSNSAVKCFGSWHKEVPSFSKRMLEYKKEKKVKILALGAECYALLAEISQKLNTQQAVSRYDSATLLGVAAVKTVQSMPETEGGEVNSLKDYALMVLSTIYASSAVFYSRLGVIGYGKSTTNARLALHYSELSGSYESKVIVLYKVATQNLLVGALDLCEKLFRKVCWICRFTKTYFHFVEAYMALISSDLLQGKVVQAYYDSMSLFSFQQTPETARLLGFVSVLVDDYKQVEQCIGVICRIDMSFKVDLATLETAVKSNNSSWVDYLLANLLARKHKKWKEALEIAKRGAISALADMQKTRLTHFDSVGLFRYVVFIAEAVCTLQETTRFHSKKIVAFKYAPKKARKVVPLLDTHAFTDKSLKDAIRVMANLIHANKEFALLYSVFMTRFLYSEALLAKLTSTSKDKLIHLFSRCAQVSDLLGNPYLKGLASLELAATSQELGKLKNKETYTEIARIAFLKTLQAKVEPGVVRKEDVRPHEMSNL